MPEQIAPFRYWHAWLMSGALAALLLILGLGVLALAEGLPFWIPMNATTQVFHGPGVADVTALDFRHSVVGTLINVAACFFWAAIAAGLFSWASGGGTGAAWLVGLGTVALAGFVDYLLIPERLRPGWELVLSPAAVACGFLAMGIGLALGLVAAANRIVPVAAAPHTPVAPRRKAARLSALARLRQPVPNVLDQRAQRIDPAGKVTQDPNDPDCAPRDDRR